MQNEDSVYMLHGEMKDQSKVCKQLKIFQFQMSA